MKDADHEDKTTDEGFMEQLNEQTAADPDTDEAIQESLARDAQSEAFPETSFDAPGFGERLSEDDRRVDGDLEFRREDKDEDKT